MFRASHQVFQKSCNYLFVIKLGPMPFYSRIHAIGLAGLGRLAFAVCVVLLECVFRFVLLFVPSSLVRFLRVRLSSRFPSGRSGLESHCRREGALG